MATTSRIIPGVNQDNTGRNFSYDFQTPAFAATLALVTSAYGTTVVPANITGAMTINIGVGAALVAPYVGDEIQLILSSTVGATVTFGSGWAVSSSSSVIGANKVNSISAMFNGTVWVETGRSAGA